MSVASILDEVDPDLMKEFVSGCEEHIAGAESTLIELEKHPESADHINEIFRHFHSIKGDAASIGIQVIRDLAHEMESMLDEMRTGSRAASPHLLDLLLEGVAMLAQQLKSAEAGGEPAAADDLIRRLKATTESVLTEVVSDPRQARETLKLPEGTQANEMVEAEVASEKTYILFQTGELRCAINVDHSNEIISKSQITPVPNVESFIAGVINLRGSIVPVINLAQRLKIAGGAGDSQQILILIIDGSRLGLLVDGVLGVETWSDKRLLKPSSVSFDLEKTLVSNVVVENNRIHLVLNLFEIIQRRRDAAGIRLN